MNMEDSDEKAFDFEQDDKEVAREEEQRTLAQFQEESESEEQAPQELLESGDERVNDKRVTVKAEEPQTTVPMYQSGDDELPPEEEKKEEEVEEED